LPTLAPVVSLPAEPHPICGVFRDLDALRRLGHVRGLLADAGVFREHLGALLIDVPAEIQDEALAGLSGGKGVLIVGAPGVGKSRLAVALLRIAVLQGQRVRFALAGDVLSEIRETYRDDAPRSERAVVESLCGLDVLVLDDLGREGGRDGRASDYVTQVLHRVLSKRLGMGRVTIVTSNQTAGELEERYDPAIGSRLRAFERIVLAGKDWRLGAA
jgi:DNA replication protein DnaC